MTEPYEPKFAPCPFCGSDDIAETHDSSDDDPHYCEWEVECMECHAFMSSSPMSVNPKQELIDKWNRRPHESTELNKLMDMVNDRDSLLTQLTTELIHWNAIALSRVDIVKLMESKYKK